MSSSSLYGGPPSYAVCGSCSPFSSYEPADQPLSLRHATGGGSDSLLPTSLAGVEISDSFSGSGP